MYICTELDRCHVAPINTRKCGPRNYSNLAKCNLVSTVVIPMTIIEYSLIVAEKKVAIT